MHLNPYGSDAVAMAVDLVTHPPATPAELEQRCRSHGVVIEKRVTRADLTIVQQVLQAWLAVVDADGEDVRAKLLNDLLASYASYPRLTDHANTGWHVHYRPENLPVGRIVAALVTVGTALHLAGRGMNRLGRCSAEGCERVYADLSRTGRQRYCSPACANRDAVRRHRSRSAS
jgi:predicted RNA-binding Zn ribbon-like protein